MFKTDAVVWRFSVTKVFLKISQDSQEITCARVSFLACNFIKKESLAQVFSFRFCEISKNTVSHRHLRGLLIDQVKFTKYSLYKTWSGYTSKFLKGCIPQILLGPILNSLSHLFRNAQWENDKIWRVISHTEK